MYKLLTCILIAATIIIGKTAVAQTRPDSIKIISELENKQDKASQLAGLIANRFLLANGGKEEKQATLKQISRYSPDLTKPFEVLIDVQIARRQLALKRAEQRLFDGIALAKRTKDAYFQYLFHLNLAFVQTDLGDQVSAIYNYGLARVQALQLNNDVFLSKVNLGLSDLYYKTGLFEQSLAYLDQLQLQVNQQPKKFEGLTAFIHYNKAENFFRLNNADSLAYYSHLFLNKDDSIYNHHWLSLRLRYYQLFIKGRYAEALPIIKQLIRSEQRDDAFTDQWALTQAYFKTGRSDSARLLLKNQIARPETQQQSLMMSSSYETLSRIDAAEGDYNSAYQNAQIGLDILDKRLKKVARVGDVSSKIRTEQVEIAYQSEAMRYKRERVILIFAILLAVLVIMVSVMLYRNMRQQSRYEKLLYADKRQELAFINSHEVRRHLSNILGLCDMLKAEHLKPEEIDRFKDYLHSSAKSLDESIKNIERKLNEH